MLLSSVLNYLFLGSKSQITILSILIFIIAFDTQLGQGTLQIHLAESFPTEIRGRNVRLVWNIGYSFGALMLLLITLTSNYIISFYLNLVIKHLHYC